MAETVETPKRKPGRPRSFKRGGKHSIYLNAALEEKTFTFLKTNAYGNSELALSELVRRALLRYFKQEDTYWSLQFKFLEKQGEKLDKLTFWVHLLSELFSHYLAYFFLLWPERSPEESRSSLEKSYRMTAVFKDALKDVLSQGGYLWDFSPEHIHDMILDSAKELDLREVHAQAEQDRKEIHQKKPGSTSGKTPKG